MGKRLENLFEKGYEWLTYKEVDELVRKYQAAESQEEKDHLRYLLLQAFHKYFMKYVSILKGTIGTINAPDTIAFLSLFRSKSQKQSKSLYSVYRYVIRVCENLQEEEVYNQMVTIFLTLLDQFKFQPEVSFSHYITKYMRWSTKAWIMRMSSDPLTHSVHTDFLVDGQEGDKEHQSNRSEMQLKELDLELPEMNLAWVMDAGSSLFSILTKYERFLLYLSFKEGLGVRKISERLGRVKGTVNAHMRKIIIKLREHYQKGAE